MAIAESDVHRDPHEARGEPQVRGYEPRVEVGVDDDPAEDCLGDDAETGHEAPPTHVGTRAPDRDREQGRDDEEHARHGAIPELDERVIDGGVVDTRG